MVYYTKVNIGINQALSSIRFMKDDEEQLMPHFLEHIVHMISVSRDGQDGNHHQKPRFLNAEEMQRAWKDLHEENVSKVIMGYYIKSIMTAHSCSIAPK